ncbi:MAG: cytochrome c oxidase subunit 3, partial [Paraglaciecola chathamensis]
MAQPEYEKYYVPDSSPWPIVGAVALFLIAVGAGNFVIEQTRNTSGYGGHILVAGFATLIFMLFGWFRNQIHESMSGLYSAQLGRSYRQGMAWFIFSEVMFFGAFFGALFYARMIAIPWLG